MFRLMIIYNKGSKVPDDPPPLVHLSSLKIDMDQSEACLIYSVRWSGVQVVRVKAIRLQNGEVVFQIERLSSSVSQSVPFQSQFWHSDILAFQHSDILTSFCHLSDIFLTSFWHLCVIFLSPTVIFLLSLWYLSVISLVSFCRLPVAFLSSFCHLFVIFLWSFCHFYIIFASSFCHHSVFFSFSLSVFLSFLLN